MTPEYPINLRLAGKPVLLIGGGEIAEGRACALVLCRAEVTLISPRLTPGLQGFADRGEVRHLRRRVVESDIPGHVLVLAATGPHLPTGRGRGRQGTGNTATVARGEDEAAQGAQRRAAQEAHHVEAAGVQRSHHCAGVRVRRGVHDPDHLRHPSRQPHVESAGISPLVPAELPGWHPAFPAHLRSFAAGDGQTRPGPVGARSLGKDRPGSRVRSHPGGERRVDQRLLSIPAHRLRTTSRRPHRPGESQ
ncbi:MAG: NAD(P)-dependent oxidoreductase [Candidatus Sumerlaeia bacterium]|nr:NAD(P)-dependent oxidoreductase [Candidatus Sumerlaeia bacterium]